MNDNNTFQIVACPDGRYALQNTWTGYLVKKRNTKDVRYWRRSRKALKWARKREERFLRSINQTSFIK